MTTKDLADKRRMKRREYDAATESARESLSRSRLLAAETFNASKESILSQYDEAMLAASRALRKQRSDAETAFACDPAVIAALSEYSTALLALANPEAEFAKLFKIRVAQ